MRGAGYPYVIAIFIESPFFSPDEIVEAWFGQEQVVVDIHSKKIIETRLDLRGLYYWKEEIHHKSVSGTLVFKTQSDREKKARYLKSWFIINPYANIRLPINAFPVFATYHVTEESSGNFKMGWTVF